MSAWDAVKSAIRVVAPAVASVIGTPIAGVATSALCNLLLGKDNGSAEEISTALASASPEILLKLKELDLQTKQTLAQLEVDLEKLQGEEMDSARNREIGLAKETGKRDWVMATIALAILIGFFGVIAGGHWIDDALEQSAMITFQNAIIMVLSYYFGSSHAPNRPKTGEDNPKV